MLRLFYGSPQFTVDLATADSKEGSDPEVVGNVIPAVPEPHTPTGVVSDSRCPRRPNH